MGRLRGWDGGFVGRDVDEFVGIWGAGTGVNMMRLWGWDGGFGEEDPDEFVGIWGPGTR